eukprot:jgi/Ulvmu1/8281/UM041_0093.1
MLRSSQRVHANLNRLIAGSSAVREHAAAAWPTDVSVPDGMTPFDPKGSFGQVDKYTQGLPENDALVQFVRKLRDLRLAVDKMEAEKKAAGPSLPRGLMTLSDGSVDASYYTDGLGIHPDFVTGLKSMMAEEAGKQPAPKPDTTWEDMWKIMAPGVTEAQQKVLTDLDEVRKQERQLADLEERLDEITVDEMLELYPQLAQEIKDEIEAGDYSKTDAGHKLPIDS